MQLDELAIFVVDALGGRGGFDERFLARSL
jgi:hypothetical protein